MSRGQKYYFLELYTFMYVYTLCSNLPISIHCNLTSEDAPRNIYAMKEMWANEYGIQKASGFDLMEKDDIDGREVYATTTADMPTGTSVLYVPQGLILSSDKAMEELRRSELYDVEQQLIASGLEESDLQQYYLMLKLLSEIQNGRESPWYSWLNSLPRYFSNAPAMTDYCLVCLPPLMRKIASEERTKQQQLCNMDALGEVPFLTESMKSHESYIKWAYQIVYTRAVPSEDGTNYMIIPLADYFNHGSEYQEITSSFDEQGNYMAYTSYDVPAGSPLRISYASGSNPSHLLARYGFLDEDCPATYCKLLPPTVNQDMLDLGYSYERMLFYKSGEVADEVWDIFLYDVLNNVNSNEQQQLMNAHRTGDYSTKLALHEKYYTETSTALLAHIDNFIEDIDTLLHKAETVGVNDPTNSPYIKYEHPRLPLIHRHNLFVRETFQAVRDLYTPGDMKWKQATRYTVQECDEVAMECAMAECVEDANGNWECEGGLGPNADGSERPYKTQQIIMQHSS